MRPLFLLLLLLGMIGVPLFPAQPAHSSPARPNLVFILADDLGWSDIGYHHSEIRTPELDRFAAEGVRLESHTTSPVCSPSRAALLTGRYPCRLELFDALPPETEWGLPAGTPTLPELLRAGGYETALVGKWHLGHERPEDLPTRHGFEHQYGGWDNPGSYFNRQSSAGKLDWHRDDGPAFFEPGYLTELQGDEAVRRIKQHDPSRPLFLYLAFNAPHQPLEAPDAYLSQYPDLTGDRKIYAAMVSCLDVQVGRVRDSLAAAGMLENTIVVFQSDNGGNLAFGGRNDPLRGGKHTPYEGGTRVPAFAWCPSRWQPRITKELSHTADWLPTLAALSNIEAPAAVDGKDLAGLLNGGASPHPGGVLEGHAQKYTAYRDARFKVVRTVGSSGGWRLFDLDVDELQDVAGSHPDVFKRLRHRAEAITGVK